jgi:hypothetical protein
MSRSHSTATLVLASLLVAVPILVSAATSLNQVFSEIESQYGLPAGILAKIAHVESGGNPNARSRYSTATGLFQWLEKSWLHASYALYGRALNLTSRTDPVTSAKVTAFTLAQAKTRNGSLIQQAGVDMSLGLYMGHFLGQAGAARFFSAYIQNPNADAASIFPREANSNAAVFGSRTLAQVLNFMANKLKVAGVSVNISGNFSDANGISMAYSNADVTPNDFFPKSFTPSPQASTFSPQNSAQLTQTPKTQDNSVNIPSASLIIAQPKEVRRGDPMVVSWTSVGMSAASPCVVFMEKATGSAQIARGNEGTRRITTDATTALGTWNFRLQCTSPTSTTKTEQTASIILK